ncbi:hypothetical protein [Companilactobacillus sp. HBUAS59699]|uniref:hypothetical protein n=1 Tax=Companilactobacillus sp. HBUAS59699 TaxID=3109358 RepID=UPI002FEF94C8
MSSLTWKRIILSSTFIVLSVLYTFLLVAHGSVNWNLMFDLERIKSLGNIFISPTNFNFWNHSASPVNLFMPWLTLLPFWPLFQIGNSTVSYVLLIFIVNLLTFISAYYFCDKLFKDTLQSFLFSIIYTLSLTRFNLLSDNNISSYLVLIFLPMTFYGLFQMIEGEFNHWPVFGLGMSLIALTTPWMALSVGFISVLMICSAVIFKASHHWKYWGMMLLTSVEALLMVVISTLGYTLPMLEQNNFTQDKIKSAFIEISKFDFQNYYKSAQNKYLLMLSVFLILAIVVLYFLSSHISIKVSILGIVFSGMLSTDLLPWKSFNEFDFTKVTFYFWLVCIFLICLFVSYVLSKITEHKSSLLKLAILLLTAIVSCWSVYVSTTNLPNGNLLKSDYSNVTDSIHSPTKASKLNFGEFIINGKPDKLSVQADMNSYEFKYYAPKSATIDVPVIAYNNRTVQINNESVSSNVSDRGTVKIKTQPGANMVQINYHYTNVAKVSLVISAIGFLVLCWLILNNGRWTIRKIVYNG